MTKFTNILYQIWAKKGNELYICDFIPNTLVVVYLKFFLIYNIIKVLTAIGKHLKKYIDRDAVNEKRQKFVKLYEINSIKNTIISTNEQLEKKVFENAKINEVKMFLEE